MTTFGQIENRTRVRVRTASPRLRVGLSSVLFALVCIVSTPAALGQSIAVDRVVIRQGVSDSTLDSLWKPLNISTLTGRILDFNAVELTIETDSPSGADGPLQRRIPSDQVQRILPAWNTDGVQNVGVGRASEENRLEVYPTEVWEIVQLFEGQKYREFIQKLREADTAGIPNWQQLLLLSMVIQAVDAVQGPAAAIPHFLKMAESAPMCLFAEMPLCWTAMEPSAELVAKSLTWLDSQNEIAQLLGASWLAHGAHASRARETITKLKSSKKHAVASLATAQAWRFSSPPDTLRELSTWIAFRDKMLLPLAMGPTEFIADRLARVGEIDLAIGQYAWIATHHQGRVYRAQRALNAAVKLLKRNNRNAEAERMAAWSQALPRLHEGTIN